MVRITSLIALLSLGSLGVLAGGDKKLSLAGKLELTKDELLKLTLLNTSDKPVTFLDIPEGCAWCDKVWHIDIQVGKEKLPAFCLYAPAGFPSPVTLKPGQTFTREFRINAYVRLYLHEGKQAEVRVRYEVDPMFRGQFPNESTLRFTTPALKMKLKL